MSGETVITVIGNLTSDPEIRFTPNGVAVASFMVASTPRSYNKATGQWEDGNPLFLRCSGWREMAENISESLTKGTRVIVTGRLEQHNYTDKNTGQSRSSIELQVDEIGPSLRFAKAQVVRNQARGTSSGAGQVAAAQAAATYQAPAGGAQDDPWATSQAPTPGPWA